MAAGYHVTKTSGIMHGQPTVGVHVVYQDDDGQITELVRIGCHDTSEQDRIVRELGQMLTHMGHRYVP